MSTSDPNLLTEPDPMISYDLLNEKGIAQSKCAARLCRGSHSLNVSVRRKPNSYHRMLILALLVSGSNVPLAPPPTRKPTNKPTNMPSHKPTAGKTHVCISQKSHNYRNNR
jgi:hypothetical protein